MIHRQGKIDYFKMAKKKVDREFEDIINDPAGSYYFREIHRVCEKHSLNYFKALCLMWQESTNKKCTNKKHKAGKYKKELECEAQLVEQLELNIDGGQMGMRNVKKIIKKLEDDCKNLD